MTFNNIGRTDSFARSNSTQAIFRNLNAKLEEEKEEELLKLDENYKNTCSLLLKKYPLVDLNSDVFKEVTFYNKEFEVIKSKYDNDCEKLNGKYTEKEKNFRKELISSSREELTRKRAEQAQILYTKNPSSLSSTASEPALGNLPVSSRASISTPMNPSALSSTTSEPILGNLPESSTTSISTAMNPSAASSMDVVTTPSISTYITVKFDTKFKNFLSICGNGPNMSWEIEKAIPLRCIGKDTWIYETNTPFEKFEYKLLFNNKTWEKGPNHFVHRDNPVEIAPIFPL